MKSRGIKANFIFNVIGPMLSLGVLIVTTPVYISHIGNARYGLLSITWRLLGYFGFLDLGLSRASANALAKLGGPSTGEERAKVLMTALWINAGLGIVGGIIFYFTGIFLIEHLLDVPADLRPEIDAAFPWVACVLPLGMIGGIGYGALESRERFLAANVLGVIGSTVGVVAPVLCAIFISPSLTVVIPAAVMARAFSVIASLAFALYSEGPLNPWTFDWKKGRSLLSYGGWISLSNITGPILASVDQLVIGSILGVAAVAYYAVPMSIVVRSQLLSSALSRTLFPRISRSTPDEAKNLAEKGLVTLAYAYGAICVPAMIVTQPLLELWMGREFGAIAGPIGELLLIGAWINGLGFISFTLLQGQGRPDIVAKVDALAILPYIVLVWFLAGRFGLLGAAASWDLMVTIHAGFVFAASRFHLARLAQLIPAFGFILAAYIYVSIWPPTVFYAFLAAPILAAGVGTVALILDTSLRDFVATLLRIPKRSQGGR